MVKREPEWAASRLQHGEKIEAQNAEMLAMLEELEWDDEFICPSCGALMAHGHAAHCKLGKILKQTKGA